MTQTILFAPLLPWSVIWVLAALTLAGIVLALWRGLAGWALRALAAICLLLALLGPLSQTENRAALNDIVLVAIDETASQSLSSRDRQMDRAQAHLEQILAQRPNTETRWIRVADGPDDSGSLLMEAISNALANEPSGRVAGIFALSDGRIHDADPSLTLPAPLHLMMTGEADDWDRRLIVRNAPAFAIIGEPITLTLRLEDNGATPTGARQAPLDISIAGAAPQRFNLPLGVDFDLPLTLPHGGRNVIQFSTPEVEGEITARNNSALIQINGVRDRLRVLLVSGEPHPGGRTWRNLLKSDSSVDLVHFTILRPPEKQDGVPVDELSLIAFPTRELFLEKIEDFDLIIFDRYKRRGILPAIYLDNVANYVEQGGAVLVAAGPDFAGASSIYRSPLSRVLPAMPSARVLEQLYYPEITALGERHPVTLGLDQSPQDAPAWGPWLRQIEVTSPTGHVLMSGLDQRPLLVLDRIGEGRVALLASDHAWLWSRGYQGGGPQLELLRRLAHWMMKEPELEEEMLWADISGQNMQIFRRRMEGQAGQLTITAPDGQIVELPMEQRGPGLWGATYTGDQQGLYRLTEGDLSTVVGLGSAAPREFQAPLATASVLAPVIAPTRGGIMRIAQELPKLRDVKPGRPAAGRGWLGLTPRGAYETLSVSQKQLFPPWLSLLLAAGFLVMGWLREGRR